MIRKLVILVLALVAGCGVGPTSDFPNRILASDGTPIVLDDIEAIVDDNTLTAAQKRAALRDLGLQDEKLIDALLGL